jgi:hypothetical protein
MLPEADRSANKIWASARRLYRIIIIVHLPFRLIVGSIFGYLCRVEMTITTIRIMKIMKI